MVEALVYHVQDSFSYEHDFSGTKGLKQKAIKAILDELDKKGIKDVWVRPETAGRIAQFGTLAETFEICSEFDNVLPCIDWSHIHATSNGKYNTTKELEDVLNMMEKKLGKRALQNVHFHC